MLNTLSSRATFYDVIGYLVPGVVCVIDVSCVRCDEYDSW